MFCPSHFQHNGMENDLLHNLRLTVVKNPSGRSSILNSFVKDLSFWDIGDMDDPKNSRRCSNSKKKRVFVKDSGGIPTMNEAIDMDIKGKCFNDEESESSSENSLNPPCAVWKSALDPASGNTYYYDTISRKTQWKKPAELKALERRRKREKRRIARAFFNEMEKNILDSLSRGEVIPGIPFHETKGEGPPQEPIPKSHVRTISAMHGVLLEELGMKPNASMNTTQEQNHETPKRKKNTIRNSALMTGRPPLPGSKYFAQDKRQRDSFDENLLSRMDEKIGYDTDQKPDVELAGEKILDAPINGESHNLQQDRREPFPKSSIGHTRRNTGGTIYLQNFMTNPDIKATIKCVCGLYRAHIGQSMEQKHACDNEKKHLILEFDVFDDKFGSPRRRRAECVPSLTEIAEFYEAFYERSQMEHDTIIFSLIYIERLIKSTDGTLSPYPGNWRSFLFSCMVLASKVWDDLSMWNNDFANVTAHTIGFASFTLSRINELELALLKCLEFDVKVTASEYAKYYFLIRTMLLQSGLVKEDDKPLGKRGAFEKLESLKTPYFDRSLTTEPRERRTKSMDGSMFNAIPKEEFHSGDPVLNDSVCLEQLVN
mmetsp:Transcript_11855/g.27716  ORF Transcript_11855/g.27716 Transcript_11855/m.27716 type:complete len:600 (+) Transcript_11855:110-1909(+)